MSLEKLTADEIKLLQNSDLLFRTARLRFRSALAAMRASVLDYDAVTGVIYDKLDDADLIPTTTGLAGAKPVTKTVLVTQRQQLDILEKLNADPQVLISDAQLIGAVNINGQF